MNLRAPSNPSDSTRTLSPSSNGRVPARLELRSLCRLSGRAYEGVFGRDTDATDDGLLEPLKDAAGGESDATEDISLALLFLCCEGSFALIASANALEMASTSCWGAGAFCPATLDDRDRPGVGIPLGRPGVGMPDCLGLYMVVAFLQCV